MVKDSSTVLPALHPIFVLRLSDIIRIPRQLVDTHSIPEKISKKDGFEGNFLPERIIEYAQLSSFVHGGLAAHKELVDFKVSDHPEKVYLERCSTALLIATSIKVFSYTTLSRHVPEFQKLCYDTTSLMEKIKK